MAARVADGLSWPQTAWMARSDAFAAPSLLLWAPRFAEPIITAERAWRRTFAVDAWLTCAGGLATAGAAGAKSVTDVSIASSALTEILLRASPLNPAEREDFRR